MKIFGSITELFTLVFRRGSAQVTLKPDDNQSATVTVTIPQTLSNDSFVLNGASSTFLNKTISGDSNTLTNIAVGSLKAESANANTVLLRAATTGAVTSGTISNIHVNASAAIADSKLATISAAGKVANSATTAASSNTANAIVARDASGNFSAGTITATFSGNLTGNVTGNVSGTAANITATSNSTLTSLSSLSLPGSQVSGNISGNAANVTGTVAIANGGTGQTTANAALNALLPSQSTHSGKYLTTDGTNTSWATVAGGSGQTVYSTIVASSGGNYTSIKSAVDAMSENATIYVRNGTYTETATITLKAGQKLIGESRDSVVINSSAAVTIAYPTTVTWTGSNNSQRSTGNPEQGWRTDNTLGALTVTGNSTSATYSGTSGPAVNDEIIIGACKRPFTVTAKNTSTKTLTLSRAWQGGTGGSEGNIPYFSASGTTLSALGERVTGVYNMTITNASASMSACVDMQSSMYTELRNCRISSSSTGNTSTEAFMLSLRESRFVTVDNIELVKTAAGTTTFQSGIYMDSMWCNTITNVTIEGAYRGFTMSGSGSLGTPGWRCNIHALSINNSANSSVRIDNGLCESILSVDSIICGDLSGLNNIITCSATYGLVRCVVNLGIVMCPFSETILLTGSNTVINAGAIFGNISLANASATAGNMLILNSGWIGGTVTVNNSATVFIGNVSYQSLSGSPVKNNGFDIP